MSAIGLRVVHLVVDLVSQSDLVNQSVRLGQPFRLGQSVRLSQPVRLGQPVRLDQSVKPSCSVKLCQTWICRYFSTFKEDVLFKIFHFYKN